jgi:hypothetical protein
MSARGEVTYDFRFNFETGESGPAPMPAMPAACPLMPAGYLPVGTLVRLHGSDCGLPGKILRYEGGNAVVSWSDLDHVAHHHPDSLVEVTT